jgi:hypothetical protein
VGFNARAKNGELAWGAFCVLEISVGSFTRAHEEACRWAAVLAEVGNFKFTQLHSHHNQDRDIIVPAT